MQLSIVDYANLLAKIRQLKIRHGFDWLMKNSRNQEEAYLHSIYLMVFSNLCNAAVPSLELHEDKIQNLEANIKRLKPTWKDWWTRKAN